MNFVEMIVLPLFSLIVLFVLTKMMGYRQINQMSMYDYIIGITIGSIAADVVMSNYDDFIKPILGMIIYGIFTVILSKLTDSFIKVRYFVEGKPVVLYENDTIYNEELKKSKIDLDEFLMQCRINGYFDLSKLDQIVLETNGYLSFNAKEVNRVAEVGDIVMDIQEVDLPKVLIKEGTINDYNLELINHDRKWLIHELSNRDILLEDVIIMYYNDENNINIYLINNKRRNFV